jgi:uncharacterized protein (DUF1697 family)
MPRTIAWLRGVNVGGHRRLPMADLRAAIEAAGGKDVATYIQSGNAVFEGTVSAERIEEEIRRIASVDTRVVLRTASELAATVANDPFPAADRAHRHIFFCDRTPLGADAMDPAAWLPDRFARVGDDVHLWTPNGLGNSKLAGALTERRLGASPTARNWRTVTTMLAMAATPPAARERR